MLPGLLSRAWQLSRWRSSLPPWFLRAQQKNSWPGGGVLGDEQDRADGGGPGEGAVDVGQARRPAGGVAVGAVAAIGCGL